jgi:AraC-like DNA-binding protein
MSRDAHCDAIRRILRAEFVPRRGGETLAAASADPPTACKVAWYAQPRLFLALAPAPHVGWPTPNEVVERQLTPGSLLYLPRRSWDRIDRTRAFRCAVIFLEETHVRFLITDNPGDGQWGHGIHTHSTRYPAPAMATDLIARAERAVRTEARGAYLRAALHVLIEHLEQDSPRQAGIAETLYRSMCEYIEDHFREPIDRNSVSAAFDRHPSYVSALFREQGGCTFHEFVTRARVRHACDLLQHTEQPIKAIAASCGYESQSHFGAVFRKRRGISPAAYRATLVDEEH